MWWQRQRQRQVAAVPEKAWETAIRALPLLQGLDSTRLDQLRSLGVRFLHRKQLEPAQGAELDRDIRLEIALQAALPILELGLDWYRGWHSLILYPDQFVPAREVMDEDGLVWIDDEPKSGEAWEQGPVILSLADVEAGRVRDGYNVVIHELAHKLDLLDGSANGHPPLHREMSDAAWARDMTDAYEDHCRRSDPEDPPGNQSPGAPAQKGHGAGTTEPAIDAYGSESPAEFFAVCSETFFELPHRLKHAYPAVYQQLRAFYRQDPAARLPTLR